MPEKRREAERRTAPEIAAGWNAGERVRLKLMAVLDPNRLGTWPPLSASQQKEWAGAIVMFQEAMDQVSGRG